MEGDMDRDWDGERKKEAKAEWKIVSEHTMEATMEATVEPPKKKVKNRKKVTESVSDEDKQMIIYNNVDFALIIINNMVLDYFQFCWKKFLDNKPKLQSNIDIDIEVTTFLNTEKQTLIRDSSYHISDICDDYYDMSQDKKNSLYSIRHFCPLKTTTSIKMVILDDSDDDRYDGDDDDDDDDAHQSPTKFDIKFDIIVVQEVTKAQNTRVIALLKDIYRNNSIQSLTGNYADLKSTSLQILISELNYNIERNHLERNKRIDKREDSVREEFAARIKKILDNIRNDTSSSTRTRPSSNRSTRKVEPYSILTAIPQDRQSAILSSRRGAILLAARQYIQGKINKKTIEIIIEIDRAINLFIKYYKNIDNDNDNDNDICIKIKKIIGNNQPYDSYKVILPDKKVIELNELYNTLKSRWSRIIEDFERSSDTTSKGGKSLKKITNRKTRKRKNRKSRKHKNKRSKNNKNKRHFKIRSYKL
jgi:hypothetical protein